MKSQEISWKPICLHALRTYLHLLGSTQVPLGSCASKKAEVDEFVRDIQHPFQEAIAEVMGSHCRKRHVADLSQPEVMEARKRIDAEVKAFEERSMIYAKRGRTEAKVVKKAAKELKPILEHWRNTIEGDLKIVANPRRAAAGS